MPASESPDREEGELPAPVEELDALEETVERLLERLESLRSRAAEAEAAHRELKHALERTGGREGEDGVEERLRKLSEENERLREILREGREKAERIRSRLVLLEDERS